MKNALTELIAHRDYALSMGAVTGYINELTGQISVLRTRVGRMVTGDNLNTRRL